MRSACRRSRRRPPGRRRRSAPPSTTLRARCWPAAALPCGRVAAPGAAALPGRRRGRRGPGGVRRTAPGTARHRGPAARAVCFLGRWPGVAVCCGGTSLPARSDHAARLARGRCSGSAPRPRPGCDAVRLAAPVGPGGTPGGSGGRRRKAGAPPEACRPLARGALGRKLSARAPGIGSPARRPSARSPAASAQTGSAAACLGRDGTRRPVIRSRARSGRLAEPLAPRNRISPDARIRGAE